VHKRVI
jgi:hypothetical protein